MNVLDTDTFTTASGRTYRVDFIHDDGVETPFDNGDYMLASIAWFESGEERAIDPSTANAALEQISAQNVVEALEGDNDYGYGVSHRAIARWLRLRGATGITALSVNNYDGSVSGEPWDWAAHPARRVDGFAWLNPGVGAQNAPEVGDDAMIESELAIYSAWRTGDTFGYVTTEIDSDGSDLGEVEDGSVWGFYGLDRERDYVMGEARAAAEGSERREVESDRLAAQRLQGAQADASEGLQLLEIWKRENVIGARSIWEGHNRAHFAAGRALIEIAHSRGME